MGALRRLDGQREIQLVLRQRLDGIARRSMALLRARADLTAVVTAADERADAFRGWARPGGPAGPPEVIRLPLSCGTDRKSAC